MHTQDSLRRLLAKLKGKTKAGGWSTRQTRLDRVVEGSQAETEGTDVRRADTRKQTSKKVKCTSFQEPGVTTVWSTMIGEWGPVKNLN